MQPGHKIRVLYLDFVEVLNLCYHVDMRGTLQTRPLNRLGEAPDARCARGKSAESDWGTGPETPKGAGSLSARAGESLA